MAGWYGAGVNLALVMGGRQRYGDIAVRSVGSAHFGALQQGGNGKHLYHCAIGLFLWTAHLDAARWVGFAFIGRRRPAMALHIQEPALVAVVVVRRHGRFALAALLRL